ncbi:hypothetical protein GQ55_4G070900 [Panicum hallii var. hallii]|uniref:Neprosin PEP catalytic domain-containing protein n=1 Tax=Panicum hallii var. hallii TaxID=1504633 RepID=A0A2T7DW35_9POAL|nr:hypothetical protein GQ55_4G070900 [Panicum hallii var. hallii]
MKEGEVLFLVFTLLMGKMWRLVQFVVLLSVFCSKGVATTSLCGKNPHLCMHMLFKEEVSSNRSLVPIKEEASNSSAYIHHHAIYQSNTGYDSVVYGTMATLSVHEFPAIKKGQNILATIKVGNFQRGHKEYTNAVHAGWAIQPSFYGDSKTHFTTKKG